MASLESVRKAEWQSAQKCAAELKEILPKIKNQKPGAIDIADFHSMEQLMGSLRLPCVKIIFSDLKFAEEKQVEALMWQSHSSVSKECRQLLGKFRGSSHAVEKRKVEKAYQNFLRTSIAFYQGFIQRLNARYDIPELRRIAQGASMKLPDPGEQNHNVSVTERRIVLESCYSTLIRLGDLARYKTQLNHKKPGPEAPMTFYSLAQDLKPESGFAAHQMGMASKEDDNTFNMLYYFYRSLALKTPHPHAQSSLEATFKTVGQPNRKPKTGPFSGLQEWFTRLHSLYYKGVAFSQQSELEREVTTQLERAAKDPQSNEVLFKMALVNMSAYHVACVHFNETKSAKAQKFGGFVLCFSVKFLSVICSTLEAALRDSHQEHRVSLNKTEATKELSRVQVLAPLLRTYCTWLAARRNEVFGYARTLGDDVPKLTESLSRVFTFLVQEIDSITDLGPCPYLLSEDLEVLGFEPLSPEQIPDGCRSYCTEDGQVKPHHHEGQKLFDPAHETQARILDILRCAYFFANDPAVPLQHRVTEDGLVFDYVDGAEAANQTDPINQMNEQVPSKTATPQQSTMPPPAPLPKLQTPEQMTRTLSTEFHIGDNDGEQLSAHDYHAQETVMNMLAEVLRPCSPDANPGSSTKEDSYGMHTATANEIFNALNPETRSPNVASRAWGWPQAQGNSLSPGYHHQSPQQPVQSTFDYNPGPSNPGGAFALPNPRSPRADAYTANQPSASAWGSDPYTHRQNLLRSFGHDATSPRAELPEWNRNDAYQTARNGAIDPWQAEIGPNDPIIPASSGYSGFSHPSSLYQGTPSYRDPQQGQKRDVQRKDQG